MKLIDNINLKDREIGEIRKIDSNYFPRKNFPWNKTIIDEKNKIVVQLDIYVNICEVILPKNQEIFKTNFLSYIINLLIKTLKIPPRISNEIGHKIFFYVPENTPGADLNWWNLNKYNFQKSPRTETETILGTKMNSYNNRFILQVLLNDSGEMMETGSSSLVFKGEISQTSPSFGTITQNTSQNDTTPNGGFQWSSFQNTPTQNDASQNSGFQWNSVQNTPTSTLTSTPTQNQWNSFQNTPTQNTQGVLDNGWNSFQNTPTSKNVTWDSMKKTTQNNWSIPQNTDWGSKWSEGFG